MNRSRYVIGRLLQIVPTFLLILVTIFVLVRLLPGDPVSAMLGDRATDEAVTRMRAQLGLDQPLPLQFVLFVERLAHGDLGISTAARVPVARLVAERLPVTLYLTLYATVIAFLLAVPLAFLAALKRDGPVDMAIRGLFQVGLSAPLFYIGLLLLTVLGAWWRVFPVGGYGDTTLGHLWHLFLPALTLALSLSAILMRSLRAAILAVLDADYIDFARAKGLLPRILLGRHVLRNALPSTIALLGLNIGTLLGGAVITESVFAVPGLGRLIVDSIFARDYPTIQGIALVLAVVVSLTFLMTDLILLWLDPRIGR